jgi:predicted nuclease of predicted toxin-antitoxin system
MRFMANENFPLASVQRLREAGHDTLAVSEAMSGSRDEEVLSQAALEKRILLTFDRDYGELIYRKGLPAPPGVVYLRFAPSDPDEPARVVLGMESIKGLLLEGRYTVVDPPRIRQRPLPEAASRL